VTWHYLNDNCEPSTYSPEQEVASSPTSLRALGNGQVPQQAALAWTVLSQGLTG